MPATATDKKEVKKAAPKTNKVAVKKQKKVRLYVPAVITGFKRNLRKQYEHTNLLKLDGVRTRKDARFYLGKRVAYVWKSSTSEGPKTWNGLKVTWGKVTNVHGNSGVVRAKFNRNLPAQSIGKVAKVMLYPSQI